MVRVRFVARRLTAQMYHQVTCLNGSYVIVITRGRNTVNTQNNRPSANHGTTPSLGMNEDSTARAKHTTAKHNNNVIIKLSSQLSADFLLLQIGTAFAARSDHPSA